MSDWITTDEAVKLSGYSANHIRILIRAKKIAGQKWSQSWQISKKSLLTFLKSSEQHGQKRGRKPRSTSTS